MSAFSLTATHRSHMLVGAAPEVRVTVRVRASDIGSDGVEATLRLWTPHGATVAVFDERAPRIRDLRRRALQLDDRTLTCAAGRWWDGAREYELAIVLAPGRPGEVVLAARLAVIVDDELVGRAPVPVTWTGDPTLAATHRPSGASPAAPSRVSELPTGRSPAPRHVLDALQGVPLMCPACDLGGAWGDRFCERCGTSLCDA